MLTNYNESTDNENITRDQFTENLQNATTEEGLNVYTESADSFIPTKSLTEAHDEYDSYISDYPFDSNQTVDESQVDSNKEEFTQNEGNDVSMSNVDYQQNDPNMDYHMTEEMLMSEREREKKTKKEMEEEEREKMQ